MLNRDERLLVELIRASHPLGTSAVPTPQVSGAEWSRVAQTAQQHRIEGLLYQSVKALGLANELPTQVADALRGACLQTTAANHWAFQELGKLLQIFRSENIPVILLKGCALATTLYEGHGLRRVGDLDLLIRLSDFPRARARLIARAV